MMTKTTDLNKTAGRGAIYQVSGGITQTVIRIGASTVLARLLMPADFGLFGIALLISEMVLRIGALGMGIGIIAKKDINDRDLSTAFWTMFCLRIVMFTACLILAPVLAGFFNDPRLVAVVRTISLTFLFQIIGVIGNALLIKQMKFSKIFIVNISSSIIESGLAVILVLFYIKNYWGLVLAMVTASFWRHCLVFFLAGWWPRFLFDKNSFRFLFRYGINSLGESITSYFNQNIDFLLVGKILGPRTLGFYEFAYRIPSMILDRIAVPLQAILFPALVQVNTSNKNLAAGFNKGIRYISLICYPALGGLAVIASLTIHVLWGDKWLVIVTPLQLLCLAGAIQCSASPARVLFLCKNRPDIPFKFSLVVLCVTFLSVGTLGYFYGMIGIAVAMLISTLPSIFLLFYAFRMINNSLVDFLWSLWPILASTLIMGTGVGLIQMFLQSTRIPSFPALMLCITSGGCLYVTSLWVVFNSTFKEVIATLTSILGLDSKFRRIKKTAEL